MSQQHSNQPAELPQRSATFTRQLSMDNQLSAASEITTRRPSLPVGDLWRPDRFDSLRTSLPMYYHSQLTDMNQVFQVMQPYVLMDGAFLLRNSFSKPGVLTISVIHEQGIKHFSVNQKSGLFCVVDLRFQTVHELVQYYKHHDVPNIESVRSVRLLFPIPYKDTSRLSAAGTTPSDNMSLTRAVSFTCALSSHAAQQQQQQFCVPSKSRSISLCPDVGDELDCYDLEVGTDIQDSDFIRMRCDSELVSHSFSVVEEGIESPVTTGITRHLSECLISDGQRDGVSMQRRKTVRDKLRHFLERSKPGKGTTSHHAMKPRMQIPAPSAVEFTNTTVTESYQSRNQPTIPEACVPCAPANTQYLQTPCTSTQHNNSPQPGSQSVGYSMLPVGSDHLYYSNPRDMEQAIATELISFLRQTEPVGKSAGKCECGLDLSESELPRGWSVHLSTEPRTAGRIFFTGPDGKTSWNLPLDVCVELDAEQQERIRKLLTAQYIQHQQLLKAGETVELTPDEEPSCRCVESGDSTRPRTTSHGESTELSAVGNEPTACCGELSDECELYVKSGRSQRSDESCSSYVKSGDGISKRSDESSSLYVKSGGGGSKRSGESSSYVQSGVAASGQPVLSGVVPSGQAALSGEVPSGQPALSGEVLVPNQSMTTNKSSLSSEELCVDVVTVGINV